VVNVGTTNITNVYTKTVVNNVTVNRLSYNGGSGGVQARPTAIELAAAHAQHLLPTAAQQQHVQAARSNPALRASTNHGNPPIAATPRPGVFSGEGVMAAKHTGAVSEGAVSEPVEHKSKPVAHRVAAARVEHKSKPVAHKVAAARVEHKSKPVAHKVAAAPVEHKSEPVAHKVATASPVEHKVAAAPVEDKAREP
jgi:hypothetical protein